MPTQALLSNQSNFLRKLANDVSEAAKPIRITAEEVLDPGDTTELTLDDAIQRAQGLWLSGYTWDEIEIRLVDMEFPDNVAKKAVTKTKEYAEQKLNEGPFSTPLIEGQSARLRNGSIVHVEAVSPKQVTVSDGDELYTVTSKQIDREASLELKEAYLMRVTARQILRDAQAKYTPPELEEGYKIPKAPEKPQMEYVPKIDEKFKFMKYKKTPKELTEATPEAGEVPPVPQQLQVIINNLIGLQEMKDEVQAQIDEFNAKISPLRKQLTGMTIEQQAELRNAFLVKESMYAGLKGLNNTVFGSYMNQTVALQTKVTVEETGPGVQDTLDKLIEILNMNHPRIAKDVLKTLKMYEDTTKTATSYVENFLAVYNIRQDEPPKKKSMRIDAQLFKKIKEFFKSIVERVTAVTNRLFDKTIPLTEETTDALRAFNKKVATASSKVRINSAIESLTKQGRI